MTEILIEQFLQNIVPSKSLKTAISSRQKLFLYESIHSELVDKYQLDGWEVDKVFTTRVRMRKRKPNDMAFEDEVWTTIAKLGYEHLNKDRNFRLPYSDDFTLTQQIDVFAADKETVLIIECKATDGDPKKGNFKEAIEAIGGKKEGLIKAIHQFYPHTKKKVKFIFATKKLF